MSDKVVEKAGSRGQASYGGQIAVAVSAKRTHKEFDLMRKMQQELKRLRIQIEGRGQSVEIALLRNKRVFAYIIPADPHDEGNRLAMADFYIPARLNGQQSLVAALERQQWLFYGRG